LTSGYSQPIISLMPESNAQKRPRLSIDVTHEELADMKAAAQVEGISMNRFVLNSVRLNRSLHWLSDTGITSIDLKDATGESVQEMPIALFKLVLLSNPALIELFVLRQKPTKPQ